MSNNSRLIVDTYPLVINRKERVMVEDVHGEKVSRLRIGGQMQKAGVPNANGRIYPLPVLREAVDSLQETIKNRKLLGEFDHPPDAKIHLDRVSHLITKLWMEGDTVYGECEVLEKTIYGGQLKALLESGISSIGISSRGIGDMETTIYEGEEYYKVLPGYSFVTFDIVAEPSVHGSYMSVLENKSVNTVKEHKSKVTKMNHKKQYEKMIVVEMRNFFEQMRLRKNNKK